MNMMAKRLTFISTGLSAACFTLGSLGYLALANTIGHGFGGLFRMFLYHEDHPFQYIGLIAVIYGAMGSFWYAHWSNTTGRKRFLTILATIIITIAIASPLGGALWVIHDMQAGYFPQGRMFWDAIQWGALEGLRLGWLIMLVSIPFNIMGLLAGMFLLHILPGIRRPLLNSEF